MEINSKSICDYLIYNAIQNSLDKDTISLLSSIVNFELMHIDKIKNDFKEINIKTSINKLKKLKLINIFDELGLYLPTSIGKQFIKHVEGE